MVKDKKVLVVEDFTTTGGSVRKTVDSVKSFGGEVIGVCVMANRNPEGVNSETVGATYTCLEVFKAESFDENDCPMCRSGKPINTKIGHGKKYLEGKGK